MFSVKSDHGGFSYVRTIGYQQSFQIIDDAVLGEIMFRRGLDYIFDTFSDRHRGEARHVCASDTLKGGIYAHGILI